MRFIDLVCDVVDVANNVSKVVLAPVEIVVKGAKEVTEVVAELAEEVKNSITGE